MSTERSTDTVDVNDRLDAIVKQLDRIEEQLDKNTQRTEVSAKFVAEIHATWKLEDDSGKIPKPKTHIKVEDLVAIGTKVGTVKWFSSDRAGHPIATVEWRDEAEPRAHYAITLNRVTTPGV
jgi:hypothetical protein